MVAYMQGFVQALSTTFGMGTNGYLMVIIFSYIGGLIAEQTRRELLFRSGSGASVGVNLVQPILGARPYVDDEEEAYEEDEEISRSHRPVRAHVRGRKAAAVVAASGHRRHHRGPADRLEAYRKVSAEVDDAPGGHRATRPHRRDADEEDEDEEAEVVEVRTHQASHAHAEERREHHRGVHAKAELEENEEPERPASKESRPVRTRSQAEERALQRFVERALKNYDHAKL